MIFLWLLAYFGVCTFGGWLAPYRPNMTLLIAACIYMTPLIVSPGAYCWRALSAIAGVFYSVRLIELALLSKSVRRRTPSDQQAQQDRKDTLLLDTNDARMLGVQPWNAARRIVQCLIFFDARDLCTCRLDRHKRTDDCDTSLSTSGPGSHCLAGEAAVLVPKYLLYSLGLVFASSLLVQLSSRPIPLSSAFDTFQDLTNVTQVLTPRLPVDIPVHFLSHAPNAKPWSNRLLQYAIGAWIAYVFLNAVDFALKLCLLPFGLHIPLHISIQNHPVRSHSLGEMWSQRWNTVIQKRILKPYIYDPISKCTCLSATHAQMAACLATFAASGLWHAMPIWTGFGCVFSVWSAEPLPDINGDGVLNESEMGRRLGWLMFAFFIVQALGVLCERRLGIREWPRVMRRVWVVAFLSATIPMVLEPVMQLYGV